ncbi:hypothetical protein ACTWPB_06095 [Nocardia sp. IBHARD005]|uniref:hypothetical protein n=1 Tax=Nocardia sp. IBHARD005 TaxID=3457765 RepID=UPI0040590A87
MNEVRDPVEVLLRWQDSGAIWRVVGRRPDSVTIALYECTGGQEVDRFTSTDPALLRFLGERASSED